MVTALRHPIDPAAVTEVLVGGQWLPVRAGSFQIGTLRVGAGESGESIGNAVWFTAHVDGEEHRFSGPLDAVQALRH